MEGWGAATRCYTIPFPMYTNPVDMPLIPLQNVLMHLLQMKNQIRLTNVTTLWTHSLACLKLFLLTTQKKKHSMFCSFWMSCSENILQRTCVRCSYSFAAVQTLPTCKGNSKDSTRSHYITMEGWVAAMGYSTYTVPQPLLFQ